MSSLLLLASGYSRRFGGLENKIFSLLEGLPVFLYSLDVALRLPWIRQIVILRNPKDADAVTLHLENFLKDYPESAEKIFCKDGGAERYLSVRNGIRFLQNRNFPGDVFVHDAARPLIGTEIFERIRSALKNHPAVFPALPVVETLRKKNSDSFERVPRELYFRAQTPQAFREEYRNLFLSSDFADHADTDEMACFERNGFPIFAVEGISANIKITTCNDLNFATYFLRSLKK